MRYLRWTFYPVGPQLLVCVCVCVDALRMEPRALYMLATPLSLSYTLIPSAHFRNKFQWLFTSEQHLGFENKIVSFFLIEKKTPDHVFPLKTEHTDKQKGEEKRRVIRYMRQRDSLFTSWSLQSLLCSSYHWHTLFLKDEHFLAADYEPHTVPHAYTFWFM